MTTSKDMFLEEQQKNIGQPSQLTDKTIQDGGSVSRTLSMVLPKLRDLDAAAIDTLAKAQITEVTEGIKDGVDLFTLATKGALYFDTLKENLKPYVYGKQLAQKGDVYILNGVELSPAELGVKYSFKECQDPKWEELKAKADAAKKELEEREKFLKGIKGKLVQVIEETGEVATIYEPVKTGQMGYRTKVQ